MEKNQPAKSVLKKLSAMRATLSDDEQIYLDQLIMGAAKPLADPPGPEDMVENNKGARQNPDTGNQAPEDHKSTTEKITWNNSLEIYELE